MEELAKMVKEQIIKSFVDVSRPGAGVRRTHPNKGGSAAS